MNQHTAIIIGASGATGLEILKQILDSDYFEVVKIFVRKKVSIEHDKLTQYIIDFDNFNSWKNLITGNVLFSALGTTIKSAKTKENQFKIDFTYQLNFAKAAVENKVESYLLISAINANSKSMLFYSRMKGQLENEIKLLNFNRIHIFQPGILERNRNDGRIMERMTLKVIKFFNRFGIFKNLKPLPVELLAQKMILTSKKSVSKKINYYKLNEIFDI
jgi:uncharacterized protein YbjT (DUF2867 family)